MGYGIGLVPEDRKKEGIYAIQGIRFNTTIEVLREFLKNGRYDWDKELALTKEYVTMSCRPNTPGWSSQSEGSAEAISRR